MIYNSLAKAYTETLEKHASADNDTLRDYHFERLQRFVSLSKSTVYRGFEKELIANLEKQKEFHALSPIMKSIHEDATGYRLADELLKVERLETKLASLQSNHKIDLHKGVKYILDLPNRI